MNIENEPENAASVLYRIFSFTADTEAEIKEMPASEVYAFLNANNIDPVNSIKRIKATVQQALAKDELAKAKVLRQQKLREYETFESLCNDAMDKRDLVNKLRDVFNVSQDEALVYCRKFENANASDIKSLINDLKFLGMDKKDANVRKTSE